jgi:hypothetical protein
MNLEATQAVKKWIAENGYEAIEITKKESGICACSLEMEFIE